MTASSRRHVMTAKAEYKVRNPYSSCNSVNSPICAPRASRRGNIAD